MTESTFAHLAHDEEGRPICHVCSAAVDHLARHAHAHHGMRAAEYRESHGLGATTVLVSDAVRAKLRAAYARKRDQHLADLDAHRDPAKAAARSRSHTKTEPWAPEVRIKRQQVGRASRSRDLTADQAATLRTGHDLQAWADSARTLRASDVSLAAIARASEITPATVSQRMRRYPPRHS